VQGGSSSGGRHQQRGAAPAVGGDTSGGGRHQWWGEAPEVGGGTSGGGKQRDGASGERGASVAVVDSGMSSSHNDGCSHTGDIARLEMAPPRSVNGTPSDSVADPEHSADRH